MVSQITKLHITYFKVCTLLVLIMVSRSIYAGIDSHKADTITIDFHNEKLTGMINAVSLNQVMKELHT